jgi:AP-2 complex subunit alpha
VLVLFFSMGNGTVCSMLMQVDIKLRLPVVLNKFLQPITLSPEDFFPQWKALTVHSLKVQEVVRPGLNDSVEDKSELFS